MRFAATLYKFFIVVVALAIVAAMGYSYRYLEPLIQNGADLKYPPLMMTYVVVLSLMAIMAILLLLYHRRFYIKPLKAAEQHIRKVDLNNPELEMLEISGATKFSELTAGINMLLFRIRHNSREYKKDQSKLREVNQKLEESLFMSQSAQNGLMLQKNQFEALFKNSTDAILILNHHRQVVDLNEKFVQLFGYYNEDLRFKEPDNILVGSDHMEAARKLTEKLFRGEAFELETERLNSTGEIREVSMKGVPVLIGDEVVGAYQIFNDISVRKRSEYELRFLSYHDQLTGLYNRRFFEVELERLDTERNLPLTILMCDVNGLKITNDAFGHKMGDRLLVKTADVLRSICRAEDIIARWGGDEFVVLLPKTDKKTAIEVVERIKEASRDEKIDSILISVSIGFSVKSDPEELTQEVFKDAENMMYSNKLYEGPSMRGQIVQAILNTLHEKNPREELHSRRVSQLCGALGTAYGFSNTRVEALKTFGLMHDIGKIAIYEHLLNKSGSLSEDEWLEMKRHPEIGYRILSAVNDMSEIADLTLAHHENWDGSGYPKGLKGHQIPLESRMIQLADAYDAMTCDRPYRKALNPEVAVSEIVRSSGKQFDPELSRIFVEEVLKMTWYDRSEIICQTQ
ncbi:diguanylate cyclase [Acidaminobacter hydrogenoformans]|uniref:diguanylate cyclase n=1 Tax=Acidaminobacter hydrogenoformans TaxID=65403 RepID=UPI00147EFEBB|nr:HD domain-containing phosphohydrolase [Acidaminobacter hydrogenoformans]